MQDNCSEPQEAANLRQIISVAILLLAALAVNGFIAWGMKRLPYSESVIDLFFMTLSFEMGHVILTYFMLFSRKELKEQFPWFNFLILNIIVFIFFYQVDMHVLYRASLFWLGFNIFRMLHSTQQRIGISGLLLSKSLNQAQLFPFVKKVARVAQLTCICNYLMFYLHLPLRSYLLISVLFLVVGFFYLRSKLKETNEKLSLLSFIHFYFIPYGGRTFGSCVRAVHGFEYLYVFRKFFRNQGAEQRRYFKAGTFCLIFVSVIYFYYAWKMQYVQQNEFMKIFRSFFLTIASTHIVQDWYIFNFNKTMASNMRKILLSSPS